MVLIGRGVVRASRAAGQAMTRLPQVGKALRLLCHQLQQSCRAPGNRERSARCGLRTTHRCRQTTAGARRRASPTDDLQELARRGRWLMQTAIAEIARREHSRCPPRQLSVPEIRQKCASPSPRRSGVVTATPAALLCRDSGSRRCACCLLIRDNLQAHLLPLAWASSHAPQRRPRSRSGRGAALLRRPRRLLNPPGGAKEPTSFRPSVGARRGKEQYCRRRLVLARARDSVTSASARKLTASARSQPAATLRLATPSAKGIVPSAATGRAVRHERTTRRLPGPSNHRRHDGPCGHASRARGGARALA